MMAQPPRRLGGAAVLLTLLAASSVTARPPHPAEAFTGPPLPLLPTALALPGAASDESNAADPPAPLLAAPRVIVGLYAEALCPYCARLLTDVSLEVSLFRRGGARRKANACAPDRSRPPDPT